MKYQHSIALVFVSILLLAERPAGIEPSAVLLPLQFLEQAEQVGRMFSRREEIEFDLYLMLLQEKTLQNSEEVIVSLDRLAEKIGLSYRMNRSVYSRILIHALQTLEESYHLIRMQSSRKWHLEQEKTLLVKWVKNDEESAIGLPTEYWKFGWSEQLSFPAKWTLIVGWILEKKSPHRNGWMVHTEAIQKQFHLPPEVLEKGMIELRQFHLLETEYLADPGQPTQLQQRWLLRPFYNFREKQQGIKELEKEYGVNKVKRVIDYASVVYAEHNPEQIEQMVLLYNRYGDYLFRKIMATVAEASPTSPKRSLEYATALLQQEIR